MKKDNLTIALAAATLLSALGAFFSITRAIKLPEASTWLVPMLWVSLWVISICAVSIFVKNKLAAEIAVAASLLGNLVFAFTLIHAAITFLCIFIAINAMRAIHSDLELNVKINLWKSLYIGKFSLIFALALLITSQYFFIIKTIEGPINVPKFEIGSVLTKTIVAVWGAANPNFKAIDKEGLTVDQYILASQAEGEDRSLSPDDILENEAMIEAQMGESIPAGLKEKMKEDALKKITDNREQFYLKNNDLILVETRRQLSKFLGQDLKGDEKVTDVLVGPVSKRINDFFQLQISGAGKSEIFPLILSAVLLLTIWPMGSLLSVGWFAATILLFKIFLYFGVIKVEKIQVERERIV